MQKRFTLAGFALVIMMLLFAATNRSMRAADAAPLFVANQGSDTGDCTNSAAPCRTITYALSQVLDRSEIRVAAGVYTETVQITQPITLTGGFTLTNWITPDWTVNQTILDGQNSHRPLSVNADNSLVDSFIVRNGNATNFGGMGGGIFVGPAAVVYRATLQNLRIENNIASTFDNGFGGGMAVEIGIISQSPAQLRLSNIVVFSNTATTASASGSGGGLSIQAAGTSPLNVEMNNVTVQGNLAGNDFSSIGGGIAFSLKGGTATLRQVRILDNRTATIKTVLGGPSRGGGIDMNSGNLLLENVLMAGNQGERGEAMAVQPVNVFNSQVTLNYVTIADNPRNANQNTAAIRIEGAQVEMSLANTLISGNPVAIEALNNPQPPSLTITTTLIDNNVAIAISGTVATTGSPLRGMAGFVNGAAGDYHLAEGSDAIDSGANQLPAIDLDNVGRPHGVRSDIGAYEYAPITRRNQSIHFDPLPDVLLPSQPFTVSATASSGLTVTVATLTPTKCTVSEGLVTLLDTGTCTLQATQAGDVEFFPAPPIRQSFAVKSAQKQEQQISFTKPANVPVDTPPFAVNATASSGLSVSITSNTPAICTVDGNLVTTVALGICALTATQDGDGTFNPATPVTQQFDVIPASATGRKVFLPMVAR